MINIPILLSGLNAFIWWQYTTYSYYHVASLRTPLKEACRTPVPQANKSIHAQKPLLDVDICFPGVASYRSVLEKSKFTLAPEGVHVDTYRMVEAIEVKYATFPLVIFIYTSSQT